MKKRVLFIFIFIILFITNVKADTGDSKNEALNIEFGRLYTTSWNNSNNYYFNKITVTNKGTLEIKVTKPYDSFLVEYGALNIFIYDSNSNIVWNTSCEESHTIESSDYYFYIGLNKGTYYIKFAPDFEVKSNTIYINFRYNFEESEYTEIEPNETLAHATKLTLNHFYHAYYGNDGNNESENYDYLSFDLEQDKTYKLYDGNIGELNGISEELYSPSNTPIEIGEWQDDIEERRYFEFTASETGTYYVKLSNYKKTQTPYKIAVFDSDATVGDDTILVTEATDMANAIDVDFTKTYKARWTSKSHPYIYNKIVLSNKGIVQFKLIKPYLDSSSLNRFNLSIEDENGQTIHRTTNSTSYIDAPDYFEYNIGLASGTYYVVISPLYYNGTNLKADYTIRFKETEYTEIESNETGSDATPIQLDQFYRGFYGNEVYSDSTEEYDFYKVNLVGDLSYRIYTGASKIGTTEIIEIQDPNGGTKSLGCSAIDKVKATKYCQYVAKESGTYYIKVRNYHNKQIQYDFGVFNSNLTMATITNVSNKVFTGYNIEQEPEIRVLGTILDENFYTVKYTDNKNVGTATMTIQGRNGYTGIISKTFKINKADINSTFVEMPSKVIYTGSPIELETSIDFGEFGYCEGYGYTTKYENNINAGTAKVTFTGIGNFTGTITKTFKIVPSSIKNATISGLSAKLYTGKPVTQSLTLTHNDNILTPGVDYKLSYENNINVGTATVTITGIGNYAGSVSKKFIINRTSIKNAKVSGLAAKVYNGKAQTQNLTLTYSGITLQEGTDYKLSYNYNTDVGVAEVVITGLGSFNGTTSKLFRINPVSIANATITNIKSKVYIAGFQYQDLKITFNGKTLIEGIDYYYDYRNNVNVGNATVKVIGIGNYGSSVSKTFKITPRPIGHTHIFNIENKVVYTGSAIILPIVIDYYTDTTYENLTEGKDFKVTYTANKYVGTATVTITGIGNYSSKVSKSFTIIPKTPEIRTLSYIVKGFELTWQKMSAQVTGYEIEYALNNNFNNSTKVLIPNYKTTSKVITGLPSNKTYFVRMRTYKIINDKKIYSNPTFTYQAKTF